jgi:hypothetical protein
MIIEAYRAGKSIPQISAETGIARSTIRHRLLTSGLTLRTRTEAVRAAAKEGRLGAGLRGKRRAFTEEHRLAISRAAIRRWQNDSYRMARSELARHLAAQRKRNSNGTWR